MEPDPKFVAFLQGKGISWEKYLGGSLPDQAPFVTAYESSKTATPGMCDSIVLCDVV
jgi:hypothetical protein